uniref:Uncharacterized protein n=1 Tax=Pyricularia oryzae (strain P131) TaxID=1143193 RepID=L7IUW3_PYRO1
MAPCPYRIVYQGPNGGKVAFKRDGMLPGHFIRYGVQNGTKQLLPDWWDLSESMSFTAEDGIIYNRGDFLEVDTDSASYAIAILLEARRKLDGRRIVPESCQKYLRVFCCFTLRSVRASSHQKAKMVRIFYRLDEVETRAKKRAKDDRKIEREHMISRKLMADVYYS